VSDAPAIEVNGLSKHFGEVAAVNDLSFVVEHGQICGLLGPNGAGKTTTVRMVVGLIRANAGRARLLGEDVHPSSPVLRRVGLLVEKPAFVPYLSGLRNLQSRGRGQRSDHEKGDDKRELETLGIHMRLSPFERGDKGTPPSELSQLNPGSAARPPPAGSPCRNSNGKLAGSSPK